MPVIFLERIANGDGILREQVRAVAFGGSYAVTYVDETLVGTVANPGSVTGYLLVEPAPFARPPVRGAMVSATTTRALFMYDNDSGGTRTISGLLFRASDAAAEHASNYVDVQVWLGSALEAGGNPIAHWNTATGHQGALAAGQRVTLVDGSGNPVTEAEVPVDDALVFRIEAHGTAPTMGGLVQGHLS